MLAVLGFSITSLLFYVFAITLKYDNKYKKPMESFKRAYFLLALTFITYAFASTIGSNGALGASLIIGNLFLLVATLYMLDILLAHNTYKSHVIKAFAVVGFILITVRMGYFYPQPYIADEMLYFNSQRFVSFMLSAAFLLIWLPVNLRVSHIVTLHAKTESLSRLYAFLYTAATFSAVIFMLAKTPAALLLSFTALSVAFLLLILSNYAANKAELVHGK